MQVFAATLIIITITAFVEPRGVRMSRGTGGGQGWLHEGKQMCLWVSFECSSDVTHIPLSSLLSVTRSDKYSGNRKIL